jgi:hypothetical protein
VVARRKAVDLGEMGTTSLADMVAEFVPELWMREGRVPEAEV